MKTKHPPILVNGKERKCWPMPGGTFQIEDYDSGAVVQVRPPAAFRGGRLLVVGATREERRECATLAEAREVAAAMLADIIDRRPVSSSTGVGL